MPISPEALVFLFLLTAVFIFLFIRRKSTRTEMLIMGGIVAVLTPLSGSARSIVDLVFSFLFAGIAAVIFQQILSKHYSKRRSISLPIKTDNPWFLRLFILMVSWVWFALFLIYVMQTSSWQALVISALFIACYVIAIRRDLFVDAIWSGLLMTILLFVLYEVAYFRTVSELTPYSWISESLSQQFIGSAPSSVLIWAAAMGFALGPLYEYVREFNLKR